MRRFRAQTMKWLLIATCCFSATLLIAGILVFVYPDKTKPYIDDFANRASVFGFFVSVIGFILTVWAVFETLRVSTKAEKEIQGAGIEARQETRALLTKIRDRIMEETCEQAIIFASDAQHAIRSGSWLRAAERCADARKLAARLLSFSELSEAERILIRALVEDLSTTNTWIEKYKLKKKDAPTGMPHEKRQPVDSLIDELEKIRTRLQQRILEV